MPPRIRVLFSVSTLGGGGAERQVVGLLEHLDRQQFEPHLYLIERRGEFQRHVPADVPVHVFAERQSAPRLYVPGRIHRLQVHDLAELLSELQIQVLYERTYFSTMIGAAAARRTPVPRIAVIDSNPFYDLPRTAGRFLAIKRRMLRRAYREAFRSVAVSDCVRRKAVEYYALPDEAVATCLNFLELPRIDQMAAAEPQPDWDNKRFHIVALGRLQQEKGFHFLLDAMADLVHRRNHTQLLLHILGTGPQHDELAAQIQRLNLQAHVQLEGFEPNPFPKLRRADLFCLSSLYEGLPTAVLEAMVCRTPVLATDCECGPREILCAGEFGTLIPPRDVKALTEAIEDAVQRPEVWRKKVESARDHVERNYSRESGVARVESLLREAAASARRA